jgi:hypothetical protein
MKVIETLNEPAVRVKKRHVMIARHNHQWRREAIEERSRLVKFNGLGPLGEVA